VTTPSSAIRAVIDPWYAAPIIPVLQRRRAALVEALDGEVLVLTGPPPEWPSDPPAKADHIVTVGWLGGVDDLDASIGTLVERLAPDGWLHVIEPTSGPPALVRAQRLTATAGRVRTGWHLGRDLPAALRRCGLVVTDLERFSMPVSSTVLRPWVQGRSRRRAVQPQPEATS
jgi:hypothetical protein